LQGSSWKNSRAISIFAFEQSWKFSKSDPGGTSMPVAIQTNMKQPTNQEERNEDKKKPDKENPSHGIDPETKEPEMEAGKDGGKSKKEDGTQAA
jgi:hypothetical protein